MVASAELAPPSQTAKVKDSKGFAFGGVEGKALAFPSFLDHAARRPEYRGKLREEIS